MSYHYRCEACGYENDFPIQIPEYHHVLAAAPCGPMLYVAPVLPRSFIQRLFDYLKPRPEQAHQDKRLAGTQAGRDATDNET